MGHWDNFCILMNNRLPFPSITQTAEQFITRNHDRLSHYPPGSYVPLTDEQILEVVLKTLESDSAENQLTDNQRTMSVVSAESEDGYVYDPIPLNGLEDGDFSNPNLDPEELVNGTLKRDPSPARDISGRSQQTPPGPSSTIDLTAEAETLTPAAGGVTQWLRKIKPLGGTFDNDDNGHSPRIQLYDVNGKKFSDGGLRDPQSWREIAAIRRGARVENYPYSRMRYEDYVILKCTSFMRGCYLNSWKEGEDWGSAVPAYVTIYQVHPEAPLHAKAYWATIETETVKVDGQLTRRFSVLETILHPMTREPQPEFEFGFREVVKSNALARPLSAASGGIGDLEARGGVVLQGKSQKNVASRSNQPYRRNDVGRRHDYTRQPKYDCYNNYNPKQRRSSDARRLNPPPSAAQPEVQAAVLMPPPPPPPPQAPQQWAPVAQPYPPPAVHVFTPLVPANPPATPATPATPAPPTPARGAFTFAAPYTGKKGDKKKDKKRVHRK